MKRSLMILLTVAAVTALAVPTQAQAQQPARQQRVSNGSNQGFFSRLMEMERRKNAWLRSQFRR